MTIVKTEEPLISDPNGTRPRLEWTQSWIWARAKKMYGYKNEFTVQYFKNSSMLCHSAPMIRTTVKLDTGKQSIE